MKSLDEDKVPVEVRRRRAGNDAESRVVYAARYENAYKSLLLSLHSTAAGAERALERSAEKRNRALALQAPKKIWRKSEDDKDVVSWKLHLDKDYDKSRLFARLFVEAMEVETDESGKETER